MSYNLDQEKTWVARDFGLDRRLIKALSKLNFTYPTLVQAKAIPIAIQGKDLLVRAKTGAGKTYAFGLPLVHKLLVAKATNTDSGSVFGVILAPTKELCKQIEKNMIDLIYYCKELVSIVSLVNDEQSTSQYKIAKQQPDIIISTPARLFQHIKSDKIDISKTKMLVIDEADLILSFGYAEDVQVITASMPKIVQGLLMSATLSPALDKFKRVVLNNPAILKLEEPTSSGKLLQFYLPSSPQDKYLILYVFLKLGLLQGKGLIFVNDVNKCYRLKLVLQQFFINAAVLNAEMPLNSRLHILDEFNRGVFDLLIATDASIDTGNKDDSDDSDDSDIEEDEEVRAPKKKPKKRPTEEEETEEGCLPTATTTKSQKNSALKDLSSGYGVHRGLDFQGVSFVINFDFPPTTAAYTHRIGRTARAGASGTALSFVALPKIAGDASREDDTSDRDFQVLREVQQEQPRLGIIEGDNILAAIGAGEAQSSSADDSTLQPSMLAFDMREIETFRYRVEDTVRSVTAASVKELRAAELKKEILNSEKLKTFFSENPSDFKVLRHDKSIVHPVKQKEHLKSVPSYLIPSSMQAIATNPTTNKRKRRKVTGSQDQRVSMSKMRDPLRNPGAADGEKEVNAADDVGEKQETQEEKIVLNREVGSLGRVVSGRKLWKMKHHKGPYNAKANKKKSDRVAGSFQGRKGG